MPAVKVTFRKNKSLRQAQQKDNEILAFWLVAIVGHQEDRPVILNIMRPTYNKCICDVIICRLSHCLHSRKFPAKYHENHSLIHINIYRFIYIFVNIQSAREEDDWDSCNKQASI